MVSKPQNMSISQKVGETFLNIKDFLLKLRTNFPQGNIDQAHPKMIDGLFGVMFDWTTDMQFGDQ